MRIGISTLFRLEGGSLTHLRYLLEGWGSGHLCADEQLVLFTTPRNLAQIGDLLSSQCEIRVSRLAGAHTLVRILLEQLLLPLWCLLHRIDVLLCPGGIVPLWSGRTKTVVIFRNAAPYDPGIRPATVGWRWWLVVKMLGVMMHLSGIRASHVIYISNYFRDLFTTRFRLHHRSSSVLHHGRSAAAAKQCDIGTRRELLPSVSGRYLLLVSHIHPYKNIYETLLAINQFRDQLGDLKLVIVGKPQHADYAARLREFVQTAGLQDRVCFAGGVPHELIAPLLKGCELLVFPSTCENCPNILIEALAAGTPIACSNVGVMPEICQEAAIYFDPYAPDSIAAAIRLALQDEKLRQSLRRKARQQALAFRTWSEVSRETLETVRRIVNPELNDLCLQSEEPAVLERPA